MPKVKALVLISGGLDSMLAAKMLQEQGVEVVGLSFVSNFFDAKKAYKTARDIGIELKAIDFSKEHLEMVKNPRSGYGKNMNPCIDCHSLMLQHAKKIMEEDGYDFVATGEVLGQRPMSQNREALNKVEEYSGLGDKLLRPLSAKFLEETEPERTGKLKRGKLGRIKGRGRDSQMELVKKYKIKDYESPGGGCLLTDPEFSQRLLKLFENWPDCEGNDINLLKCGRIIWTKCKKNTIIIVIGRHKEDNEKLHFLSSEGDVVIELKDDNGPTTLIRSRSDQDFFNKEIEVEIPEKLDKKYKDLQEVESVDDLIKSAAEITGYYAVKLRGEKRKMKVRVV